MAETEIKKKNWVDIENSEEDEDDEPYVSTMSQPTPVQQPVTLLKKEDSKSSNSGNYGKGGDNRRDNNDGYKNNRRNNNNNYNKKYSEESRRPPKDRNEFDLTSEDLRNEIENQEGDQITFKIGKSSAALTDELITSTFVDYKILDLYQDRINLFYRVKFSREDALQIVSKDIKDYPFAIRVWINAVSTSPKKKFNNENRGSNNGGRNNYSDNRSFNSTNQNKQTTEQALITPENYDNEGFSYVQNNKRQVDESGDHQPSGKQSSLQELGGKFSGNNNRRGNNNGNRNNGGENHRASQEDQIIISRNTNTTKPAASNATTNPSTGGNKVVFQNSQRENQAKKGETAQDTSAPAQQRSNQPSFTTKPAADGESRPQKFINSKKDAAHIVPVTTLKKDVGLADEDVEANAGTGKDVSEIPELEDLKAEKQTSVELFENTNRNPNSESAASNTTGGKNYSNNEKRDYKQNKKVYYERKGNNAESTNQPTDKPAANNNNKSENSNNQAAATTTQKKNQNGKPQSNPQQQTTQQSQQNNQKKDQGKKGGKSQTNAQEVKPAPVNDKKNPKLNVKSKNVFGMLSGSDDDDDNDN